MEKQEIKDLLEINRLVGEIVDHDRDKSRIDLKIIVSASKILGIMRTSNIPSAVFGDHFENAVKCAAEVGFVKSDFLKLTDEFPAKLGGLINGLWVDERKKSKASVATGSVN